MTSWIRMFAATAVAVTWPAIATANTIVHFALADPDLGVGASTTLEIRADFDAPVLGFGIDLLLDASVLSVSAAPVIGPAWTAVFAPDGDGLAGLAPVSGVVGTDVLLASVLVTRTGSAGTTVDGGVTADDLTEGFPLLSGGFDTASFVPTAVAPVPEPTPGALAAVAAASLAMLAGAVRRDRRGRNAGGPRARAATRIASADRDGE